MPATDYVKRLQNQLNPFGIPQQDLWMPINQQETTTQPQSTLESSVTPEQKPLKLPPIASPPPVPVPAAPPPVQTPQANANSSQSQYVAPPPSTSQSPLRIFNEAGERWPPDQIMRQLRQLGVPPYPAYQMAYAVYEGARGNAMPIVQPEQRPVRDVLAPMSDLDFARTARALEKMGYHPAAARLLAPTFWQVLKNRTPVDPTIMIQFQPQLPTHIRTRWGEMALQPPGMQEAALQEWQRKQAAQEQAAEFHRRLLEAQQQLAQQQLQADVLLRQERARQAAGTTQKGIEGLQSHPTAVPPTAPYGALGQLEQSAAPQNPKQREYLQAVLAQIQSDPSFTDEQKQKLMSWLASIL